MAITSDLMGLGMAPALAGKVGHQVTKALVGIGTAQTGSAPLTNTVTVGVPTTGNTAYALPAKSAAPSQLKEYYFFNNAATAVSALVYPPGDGSTLAGSSSAAVTVPQDKGCLFMETGGQGGVWFYILSA